MIDLTKYDPSFSNFFRFKRLGDKVIVTTDTGNWIVLSEDEFQQLVEGKVEQGTELYDSLSKVNLLKATFDEGMELERYQRKYSYLYYGPNLHIVIPTLKCNQNCLYCHASRKVTSSDGYAMSEETASKTLDIIFETTSPSVIIEFQGGEPLANFDMMKYITREAVERNKSIGKSLQFSLVSNLSLMDDEKLQFILDNNIQVCTSLDGPKELHDANRPYKCGSAYDETVKWMKAINEGYASKGLDPELYHVEALLTVTKQSLGMAEAIVDEYVKQGLLAIYLRPLNPFGFAKSLYDKIGYTSDEFLAFYEKALDYIIGLNKGGTKILERYASIFLTKILTPDDPNFLDIRSPCGAGIGQVTYNYDGKVFTCDEGRMVYQMGDPAFMIGDVHSDSYESLMKSDVVKAIAVASELEGIPLESDSAYKPFSGVCPVFNYLEQGTIFGQPATNEKTRINHSILDFLFTRLSERDKMTLEVFQEWVHARDRDAYFRHE